METSLASQAAEPHYIRKTQAKYTFSSHGEFPSISNGSLAMSKKMEAKYTLLSHGTLLTSQTAVPSLASGLLPNLLDSS